MTPFASRRPRCCALLAAACGLALLATPLFGGWAQAFTFEDQGGVSKGDGARGAIVDPDSRFSGSGNGQGTFKQGNATFQFGAQPSFDRRYNSDRMFNPLGRPGEPDPR